MKKNAVLAMPFWSTSSFGDNPDSLPMELSNLGEHMHTCRASRGRLFELHRAAESLHSYAVSRFITSLVVLAVLVGVGSMWG